MAEIDTNAEAVRATVAWLANHAKGLTMIEWDLHSHTLLDAADLLEAVAAQRDAAVARAEKAEKEAAHAGGLLSQYNDARQLLSDELVDFGHRLAAMTVLMELRTADMQTAASERDTALARVAELEGENERMRARLSRANQCLGFFVSTIKCGEPWSEVCEREYAATRDSSDAAPLPTPPRKET